MNARAFDTLALHVIRTIISVLYEVFKRTFWHRLQCYLEVAQKAKPLDGYQIAVLFELF